MDQGKNNFEVTYTLMYRPTGKPEDVGRGWRLSVMIPADTIEEAEEQVRARIANMNSELEYLIVALVPVRHAYQGRGDSPGIVIDGVAWPYEAPQWQALNRGY